MIDARLQVLDFIVSPIGENGARVLLPAAGAAAIVDRQNRVSIRGEPLPLQAETVRILAVRTEAM